MSESQQQQQQSHSSPSSSTAGPSPSSSTSTTSTLFAAVGGGFSQTLGSSSTPLPGLLSKQSSILSSSMTAPRSLSSSTVSLGAASTTTVAVSTALSSSLTSSSTNTASSSENLPPRTLARVARDIRDLVNDPPDGVRLLVDGETGMPGSLSEIVAEIEGPEQTPYYTYYFQLKLIISSDFPQAPPRGYFLTKIYHPNVDPTTGAICVNTLKSDWTPTTSLSHVLKVIRCLLIVPFPESSLNDEAGKNFMDSYEEYARRAKLLAGVHGLTSWSYGGNDNNKTSTTGERDITEGKSEGLRNMDDGSNVLENNSHGNLPNGSSSTNNSDNKLVKMGSRNNVASRSSSKSLEKKKSLKRL